MRPAIRIVTVTVLLVALPIAESLSIDIARIRQETIILWELPHANNDLLE